MIKVPEEQPKKKVKKLRLENTGGYNNILSLRHKTIYAPNIRTEDPKKARMQVDQLDQNQDITYLDQLKSGLLPRSQGKTWPLEKIKSSMKTNFVPFHDCVNVDYVREEEEEEEG